MNIENYTILLNEECFEFVKNNGHGKVICNDFIYYDRDIQKSSFIIFVNNKDEKILKRFWHYELGEVEYTSDFIYNNTDIVLELVCSIMYESIMWIRNRSYTKKQLIWGSKSFPVEETYARVCVIENCAKYLMGEIETNEYIKWLYPVYPPHDIRIIEHIISTYKFNPLSQCDHVVTVFETALSMKTNLKSIGRRKSLSKKAYDIHNEPSNIVRDCGKLSLQ